MTNISGNAGNGQSDYRFVETLIVPCQCSNGRIVSEYRWFFERPSNVLLLDSPTIGLQKIHHEPTIMPCQWYATTPALTLAKYCQQNRNAQVNINDMEIRSNSA